LALIAPMKRIAGLILAGGRSSRMGAPKAFVELGGETLVERIARLLMPKVERLAVSLSPGLDAPLPPSIAVLRDASPTFEGPLAGVLAGLQWAATLEPAVSHLMTVPVDLPFLPDDTVARLLAEVTDSETVVIAEGPSGRAPLIALWPLSVRVRLADYLSGPGRKVQAFLAEGKLATARFAAVDDGDDAIDPFFNINAPEDLKTAENWLFQHRP
jgi:molybdopterin-guanine dinucleotide biosynthesis protein A